MSDSATTDRATDFAFDCLADAVWHDKGQRSFFRYRDLGVTKASGGRMRAEHIQCVNSDNSTTGWHCHDLDFQFVYVVKGHVAFTAEGWGDVVLKKGDCAHIPPFTMHDETAFSPDFEVIEITMPAEVTTLTEKPTSRGTRPDSKMIVDYLDDDSFVRGEGPRSFLEYRDFGLAMRRVVWSRRRLCEPMGLVMPVQGGTTMNWMSSLSMFWVAGWKQNWRGWGSSIWTREMPWSCLPATSMMSLPFPKTSLCWS